MATLLRSLFGLMIAYCVVAPQQVAAHFDTPRYRTLKVELAAEHPAENLWQQTKTWVGGTPARP